MNNTLSKYSTGRGISRYHTQPVPVALPARLDVAPSRNENITALSVPQGVTHPASGSTGGKGRQEPSAASTRVQAAPAARDTANTSGSERGTRYHGYRSIMCCSAAGSAGVRSFLQLNCTPSHPRRPSKQSVTVTGRCGEAACLSPNVSMCVYTLCVPTRAPLSATGLDQSEGNTT